ncbi:MAG TPA: YbaK/EbsC family protein [Terriglobales bacterium]|nr:YbaK/EbsC family protein [Terriglobales bacterium]
MACMNVKEFLDNQGIDYEIILHRRSDTAQATASAAHVAASKLAKTVVVKVDSGLHMAVVPANHRLDLGLLKAATGASSVALASEAEFQASFPGCEPGAMPPFGNVYGLPVWVDEELAANPQIVFNAGTHTELVRLAYRDFARVVAPGVVSLAMRLAQAA